MPAIKNLIFLWGFNRHEISYKRMVKAAPNDWVIHQIPYKKLTPSGQTHELHKNLRIFIKEMGLKKIYLMGHSLGGSMALDFAINNSELIEKLILVDSAGVYDQNSIFRGFSNVVRYGTQHSPNEFHKNFSELAQTLKNPILYTKLGWFAHHIDLSEQAGKLLVPTIIFWGENDRITPLWQGQKLHQAIKSSKLIVIPKVGHDWIIDQPEKLWQNVDHEPGSK